MKAPYRPPPSPLRVLVQGLGFERVGGSAWRLGFAMPLEHRPPYDGFRGASGESLRLLMTWECREMLGALIIRIGFWGFVL